MQSLKGRGLLLHEKAEGFHLANTSSSEFLTQLMNITLYEKHVFRKDNLYVLNSLYWDARSTQKPCGCRLRNMLVQKAAEAVFNNNNNYI
jgi:hypothetical protein